MKDLLQSSVSIIDNRAASQRTQCMARKLDDITDWPDFAKACGYRISEMAARKLVSARWLEIWLRGRFKKTPRELLVEWRTKEVRMMIRAGKRAKEITEHIGFAHQSSLTRALKRSTGRSLRELKKRLE